MGAMKSGFFPTGKILAVVCVFSGVVMLSGCGPTVSTRVVPDDPRVSVRGPVRAVLGSEVRGRDAADKARNLEVWAAGDAGRLVTASELVLGLGRKSWGDRDGFALMAARLAWTGLQAMDTKPEPGDALASRGLEALNQALAVFVEENAGALARGETMEVSTPAGPVRVSVRFPKSGIVRAGYFDDLLVAARMNVRGFRQRAVVAGAGVALVGVRERTADRAREMKYHPEKGIVLALSALAKFPDRKNAVVELVDPVHTESVQVAGRRVPVAADFTAPLALSFGGVNDLLLGIRNLLNVPLGLNDAGVYLTEPLDPERIPVLLIHGLSSTPIVWRNVVSAALVDPVVRRKYQFWYAFYPTGAPVVYSAALIREDVQGLRAQYHPGATARARREIDLVGYSMGGNVARILATDIGDRLWNQMASRAFDETKFDPEDVPVIRRAIFWKPLPGVRKVIFIATPHRGTRMADASFAHWGSRLVRLPGDLLGLQSRFLEAMGDQFQGYDSRPARVTGIDMLSPASPLYHAWEGLPLEPGARFYSIIGDRGRGDTPDSSDGVVGYWSSHLAGAESELIVPTGHDAQAYPGSEQQIVRILRGRGRDVPEGSK